MAEIVKSEKLVAKNGAYISFQAWPGEVSKPEMPCFDIQHAHWPLDEFEDLVKYVRAHIEEQSATGESKLSELAPEDQVTGGDK